MTIHLPGPQIHPSPQTDAPDAERTHREDRRGVGASAPYPLQQLRRGHRDPGADPAARPGGIRKYKKERSRQLRPIHHRRMKIKEKDEYSYSFSNAIRTLVMEGAVKINILDGQNRCRRTAKRPFWAAAQVRRTSVFTAGENIGAGAALPPRALKSRRAERAFSPRSPQKRTRLTSCPFLWCA